MPSKLTRNCAARSARGSNKGRFTGEGAFFVVVLTVVVEFQPPPPPVAAAAVAVLLEGEGPGPEEGAVDGRGPKEARTFSRRTT